MSMVNKVHLSLRKACNRLCGDGAFPWDNIHRNDDYFKRLFIRMDDAAKFCAECKITLLQWQERWAYGGTHEVVIDDSLPRGNVVWEVKRIVKRPPI